MIVSRYLPEPALSTPLPPSGLAREDSPTRLASSRLGDPGRRPFAAAWRFGRRQRPGRQGQPSRQFSPKHLAWERGYRRPKGGRHTIEYVEALRAQRILPIIHKVNEFLATPDGRWYLRQQITDLVDVAVNGP